MYVEWRWSVKFCYLTVKYVQVRRLDVKYTEKFDI